LVGVINVLQIALSHGWERPRAKRVSPLSEEKMAMAVLFAKGAHVVWRWGAHEAEGIVAEAFTRRVRRTIKGKTVIGNGTPEEPAYFIRQGDGGRVLRSQSELSAA
jgi:hypothetical protein